MKMKHNLFGLLCFFAVMLLYPAHVQAADMSNVKCSEYTEQMNRQVAVYLKEMYNQKYPTMGLECMYLSDSDKAIMDTLSKKIVQGKTSDAEKAEEIVAWVKRNIRYESCTTAYPMDALYERKGNCLAFAELICALARSQGILAVPVSGWRCNTSWFTQKTIFDLDGHAWVYLYYNHQWYMYDPIFGEYGLTDPSYIGKWYLPMCVDGVLPVYDGMDLKLASNYWMLLYIDGKTVAYKEGIPASQYYGTTVQPILSVNDIACMAFTKGNKFSYMDKPADAITGLNNSWDAMDEDECYAGGWITQSAFMATDENACRIGARSECFARGNGILVSNSYIKRSGKTYYTTFAGDAFEVASGDLSLYEGYPMVIVGESKPVFVPVWKEWIGYDEDPVWHVENQTPEIAVMSQDGIVTGKSEGIALFYIQSCNDAAILQVYVSAKKKTVDMTDRTVSDSPAVGDGIITTPSVPVLTKEIGQKALKISARSLPLQLKKTTDVLKVIKKAKGDSVKSWTSNKPSVVSVNKKTGKLTAKRLGKATITVKMKSGASLKCIVTVQKKAVKTKSLGLSKTKVTLKKGKSYIINVTKNPITSLEKVSFKSSNKKVATVTSKGKIAAKKKGTAIITVKASGGAKKTCKVTVK